MLHQSLRMEWCTAQHCGDGMWKGGGNVLKDKPWCWVLPKGAAPPWPTLHCQGVHPSPRRGGTPMWASRAPQLFS